jgi:hypothetical protein
MRDASRPTPTPTCRPTRRPLGRPARQRAGRIRPGPRLVAGLCVASLLSALACARLDADDLIRPELLEAALSADPAEPYERADVAIALRLEAGAQAEGKQFFLEWVRLFDGSGWRTTEPDVELRVVLPEGADAPFFAGEVREVVLQGYVPNADLSAHCGAAMRMMVASRTTGVHGLVGLTGDVTIDCAD